MSDAWRSPGRDGTGLRRLPGIFPGHGVKLRALDEP